MQIAVVAQGGRYRHSPAWKLMIDLLMGHLHMFILIYKGVHLMVVVMKLYLMMLYKFAGGL